MCGVLGIHACLASRMCWNQLSNSLSIACVGFPSISVRDASSISTLNLSQLAFLYWGLGRSKMTGIWPLVVRLPGVVWVFWYKYLLRRIIVLVYESRWVAKIVWVSLIILVKFPLWLPVCPWFYVLMSPRRSTGLRDLKGHRPSGCFYFDYQKFLVKIIVTQCWSPCFTSRATLRQLFFVTCYAGIPGMGENSVSFIPWLFEMITMSRL